MFVKPDPTQPPDPALDEGAEFVAKNPMPSDPAAFQAWFARGFSEIFRRTDAHAISTKLN
jgi:hypothetical protein